MSPGRENLNPGVVHDVVGSHMGNLAERTMLEPDGIFSPPFASTQRLQQHHVNPQQQQMGDLLSGMACGENVNKVRSFAKTFQ